ncbi:MAG: rhodanese-like domain-containing protein [Candidatus Dormibacteria bacterium]
MTTDQGPSSSTRRPPWEVAERPGRIVDVRTGWEYRAGHIATAEHVGLLRALAGPQLGSDVTIVCASGHRAAIVAWRGGAVLTGGMVAWRRAGLPVARTTTEPMRVLITLSLASLLFTVAHVIEDFQNSVTERLHAPLWPTIVAVGAVLAAQLAATAASHNRASRMVLAVLGAAWTIGAIAFHSGDLLSENFRSGLPSKALIAGMILSQATIAVVAARSVRRGVAPIPIAG